MPIRLGVFQHHQRGSLYVAPIRVKFVYSGHVRCLSEGNVDCVLRYCVFEMLDDESMEK